MTEPLTCNIRHPLTSISFGDARVPGPPRLPTSALVTLARTIIHRHQASLLLSPSPSHSPPPGRYVERGHGAATTAPPLPAHTDVGLLTVIPTSPIPGRQSMCWGEPLDPYFRPVAPLDHIAKTPRPPIFLFMVSVSRQQWYGRCV